MAAKYTFSKYIFALEIYHLSTMGQHIQSTCMYVSTYFGRVQKLNYANQSRITERDILLTMSSCYHSWSSHARKEGRCELKFDTSSAECQNFRGGTHQGDQMVQGQFVARQNVAFTISDPMSPSWMSPPNVANVAVYNIEPQSSYYLLLTTPNLT
jgi:hypothetical protein